MKRLIVAFAGSFVSLAVCILLSTSARASVIYSSEAWESQTTGALPTTPNNTDYVNTADTAARVQVAAHVDDGDAGTVDPTGQHGLVQGNVNKHMTLANPMTLASDGVTALRFDFAIYFNKGGYSLANNAFELVYSASGDFTDTVIAQRFTTVDSGASQPYEYDQTTWYPGQSVTINATDPGITFTDTAKIRWRKGVGSNGMNSSVYLDDVTITGIPEPATLALLGILGGLSLLHFTRRRR